jgi:hypothetical protein
VVLFFARARVKNERIEGIKFLPISDPDSACVEIFLYQTLDFVFSSRRREKLQKKRVITRPQKVV